MPHSLLNAWRPSERSRSRRSPPTPPPLFCPLILRRHRCISLAKGRDGAISYQVIGRTFRVILHLDPPPRNGHPLPPLYDITLPSVLRRHWGGPRLWSRAGCSVAWAAQQIAVNVSQKWFNTRAPEGTTFVWLSITAPGCPLRVLRKMVLRRLGETEDPGSSYQFVQELGIVPQHHIHGEKVLDDKVLITLVHGM